MVSMKRLVWCWLLSVLLIWGPSWTHSEDAEWRKERARAYDSANQAIEELRLIFQELETSTFSSDPEEPAIRIGPTLLPSGPARVNVLRKRIQHLIAQIDLAQDYPATSLKGRETLDTLLAGNDYFGVSLSAGVEAFQEKHEAVEMLFAEEGLQLGNRMFGLMRTGKDPRKAALEKWIEFIERVSGPYYLGATLDRQPTTMGRSLKALAVLRGVMESSTFAETLQEHPELRFRYEETREKKLRPAVIEFARLRYTRGGMLRDWCLPMAYAASRLFPELNNDVIGVTSLAEYQKESLAHARAVTGLIEVIESPSVKDKSAAKMLRTICAYRAQPFYIGSDEIRESGTLRVPADLEIEVLIENADFFGPDGHSNLKAYQERSDHLDELFFNDAEVSNIDMLLSLKSGKEWIVFFNEKLLGQRDSREDALFPYVEANHAVTPDHLDLIFLARSILPHPDLEAQFEPESRDAAAYQSLLRQFGEQVRRVSSLQFRNHPRQWIDVQNSFLEIARGFPEYSFDNLKVTTSTDLEAVRSDFEEALYGRESVSSQLLELTLGNSPHLIRSLDKMTSPDLSRRIGRFDQELSPDFVDELNGKLRDILEYRNYGLAAIDNLARPDLQAGRIMTHFVVSDYRIPGDEKTNTVMHDLVCGVEGGFGGLGQIFRSDAKGYREREHVLDAIATAEELELGEVLFQLALDINRDNEVTDEDVGRAARRWIHYFRKSQANAQFHAVPDVLTQAVRGTFLSRLVFQSESFQRAMENSRSAPVGSPLDISHDFESALSAQIRKMQSMLRQIDPETATNRNIEETAEKWQDFKVWYLESNKWLESVIADPLLIGEVSRIRRLNRKTANYRELCPEVLIFEKALEHASGEIYNQADPAPLGFARFAIDQVTQLEPDLNLPLPESEGTPEEEEKLRQLEFGKSVSNQFLSDIRSVLEQHGFEEFAAITDPDEIDAVYGNQLARMKREIAAKNHSDLTDRAKAMEAAFDAALARAISRVEADQPSDIKLLHSQTIRAAKVDRVLSEGELDQYRIDIEPSQLVHDWINHNRIEIMADFRTIELTSEARQMINKAKEERRSLVEVQEELRQLQAESLQKLDQIQDWMDQSEGGANVAVVLEEVMAMRDEMSALRKEVSYLKDSEALMRARAADFAQRLFLARRAEQNEQRPFQPEVDSTEVAVAPEPPPQEEPEVISIRRSTSSSVSRPSSSSSFRSSRSSSSSAGGFFRRLFGRGR